MIQERSYSKFTYLLVFLLLSFSGNPFFISSGSYEINYIVCMLFMAFLCVYRGESWILSKFVLYFFPYILLFTIQLVAVPDVKFSSIALFIIKNIIGCLAIMLLGEKFEMPYINLMFWLSIISLIGFSYNSITGNLIGVPLSYGRYSALVYTQITGFGGFIGRNSGMFWEPGAFQGYINLALAFFINNKEIKYKKTKFVFLVLALLTTYSTTGYLVFGVILIYMVLKNNKTNSLWKVIITIILMVSFFYMYYALDFLHDKIEWETTMTADKEKGRILDYQYFFELFKENFLLGISFVEMASGNGFLSHLLCLGVLCASYYYVKLYRQLRKSLTKDRVLFLMLIIILCLQGEGFLDYPLFLGLPFLTLKKNNPFERLVYA